MCSTPSFVLFQLNYQLTPTLAQSSINSSNIQLPASLSNQPSHFFITYRKFINCSCIIIYNWAIKSELGTNLKYKTNVYVGILKIGPSNLILGPSKIWTRPRRIRSLTCGLLVCSLHVHLLDAKLPIRELERPSAGN